MIVVIIRPGKIFTKSNSYFYQRIVQPENTDQKIRQFVNRVKETPLVYREPINVHSALTNNKQEKGTLNVVSRTFLKVTF